MKHKGSSYDVVVAGAGIGGMALAIRLGRRGHRVAIVEPNEPGKFRVGESLDWEAPVYLKRLGIPVTRWVREGKATWKGGAIASNCAWPEEQAEIGFSRTFRFLQSLVGRGRPTIHANREEVDLELAARVRAAGVVWVKGRVRSVETEGDRVSGVVLDDGRRLQGRFYVDAAGRGGMFRRRFGIGQDYMGPRKVAIRARFPHPYDGRGTRIRTDDTLTQPAWIWDIHVTKDTTDIGVVITEDDFVPLKKRLGSLRAVYLHQTQKHRDLAWLAPLVTEDTELWSCVFQDMVSHRSHGPNWIALGEAAFVVDAILSSGFTSSMRTGFVAADIVAHALRKGRTELCPRARRIYHEKTASHVRTINGLIDVLWYRGRLRNHYSVMLNVVTILAVNFNLNHIHTRFPPRTLLGLRLIKLLHRSIDWAIPRFDQTLTRIAVRRGKTKPLPAPDVTTPAEEQELVGVS